MNSIFGYRLGSFEWFSLSYVGDWFIVTSLWLISSYLDGLAPFERDFSLEDPLINHPHTVQQIGGSTNNLLAFVFPLFVIVALSLVNFSPIGIHHNILGLWTARASSRLITEFLKNSVGRLRPDFLARCAWDETTRQCTGKSADVLDGRRSFPSGHSSTAFAGMTFFFLWISAQTAAWHLARPLRKSSIVLLNCRSLRIVLSLAPLSFATWVAVSRVEDYRHHKEDVIVGSVIGVLCGSISYLMYWPNPLLSKNMADGINNDEPLDVYGPHPAVAGSPSEYQLANMEDGGAQV